MNFRCLVSAGLIFTVACGGEEIVSTVEEDASTNLTEGGGSVGGDPSAPSSDSSGQESQGVENREVLMLGDSLLAWFREEGASVGDYLENASSFSVANLAVSGSMVLEGEEAIPSQYVGGDWGWVVFDGGGNDVNDLCDCGSCDAVLDEIISSNSDAGAVPGFTQAMVSAGHRVLVLGYYGMPESAQHGFNRCNDEAGVLNQRYRALAAGNERIYYFDLGQVVSPSDLRDYDDDHVHPSERGAQKMGRAISAYLESIE